ncbi:MAG: hypothetical protein KA715_01940 [Xanthomonadaceae bacterium]|nr:hypothetical protein [Xanthomonadaceae bacterium]
MNGMALLPELMLLLTLVGLLVGETIYSGESRRLLTSIALIGQLAALVQVLLVYQSGAQLILEKTAAIDGIAIFFKFFFILFGVISSAISVFSIEIKDGIKAEFHIFQLGALLFLCLLASAVNLMLISVCLLALNITCYFLSSFSIRDKSRTSAGEKIYLFTSASFFLFLIPVVVLFGFTHSLSLFEIREALVAQPLSPVAAATLTGFLFSSLLIQCGVFPFHFWFVDALEGTPTPTEFFMITAIRGAGFIILLRILGEWMSIPSAPFGNFWKEILVVGALASIGVGAVSANFQSRLKRLLAYLVVAETGYWILALTELDTGSVAAALFGYMCDALSLCGAYLMFSENVDRTGNDLINQFGGLAKSSWVEYACTAVFLLSFVGVPPLPGFYGKWLVIGTMFRNGNYALGIAVSLFILFQLGAVIKYLHSMIHNDGASEIKEPKTALAFRRRALSVALVLPLLFSAVYLEKILVWSETAIQFILW